MNSSNAYRTYYQVTVRGGIILDGTVFTHVSNEISIRGSYASEFCFYQLDTDDTPKAHLKLRFHPSAFAWFATKVLQLPANLELAIPKTMVMDALLALDKALPMKGTTASGKGEYRALEIFQMAFQREGHLVNPNLNDTGSLTLDEQDSIILNPCTSSVYFHMHIGDALQMITVGAPTVSMADAYIIPALRKTLELF